jgi:hypothetical protein
VEIDIYVEKKVEILDFRILFRRAGVRGRVPAAGREAGSSDARLPAFFASVWCMQRGMADDADTAGAGRESAPSPATTHARTDRRSAGRSVETRPESLYLWQIAVLRARVDTLERRVDTKEQDLQHVIDQYEGVLQERPGARDGELLTDGGDSTVPDTRARTAGRAPRTDSTGATGDRTGLAGRLLDRLRSLL